MRKIAMIVLITVLVFCKDASLSKEDKDSLLVNMGLLFQRSNRLTISGTAVKGIIKNAIVTVNPLNKDGSCNASVVLATETTDDTGNYSLVYNKTGSVVCLTISSNANGLTTMFDEKSNGNVGIPATSSFKVVSILPESKILNNAKKNAMVSPFSKMIAKRLAFLVKQAGDGADTNKLYTKASKEIVIRFGLQKGLSSASGKIIPISKSASISDADYSELDDILLELENPSSPLTTKFISILVGFSHLANKHKKGGQISIDDIDEMIEAFAADFEDGLFDGKTALGKAITVGTGANQLTFSATPLTTSLLPAIAAYIQEGGKLTVGKPTGSIPSITVAQFSSQVQFVDNAPIVSGEAAPTLSYAGNPFSLTQNAPIVITPIVTGTILNCTVSPTLPVGLSIGSTCIISGTPTVFHSSSNFTITASGSTGSTTVTISIGVGDLIAINLTASLASYTAAAVNDLVKVSSTEYTAVQTGLSASLSGYNGTIDSNWATAVAANQTYAYQSSFVHANTVTTLPASSYVVAFTFIPSLNPQNSFSCQVKYNNGNSLTNISNLYNGNTIAVQDRQYFVIKKPNIQVASTSGSYLALFSTSGIGTTSIVSHNYDYVTGNQVGAQTFTNGSAASTQYPTMQALTSTTKSW